MLCGPNTFVVVPGGPRTKDKMYTVRQIALLNQLPLTTHLSAQRCSSCAFGLLEALWQRSIAGPQLLAGRVVDFHGDTLCGTLLG